jgi:hypothetical protein
VVKPVLDCVVSFSYQDLRFWSLDITGCCSLSSAAACADNL